MVSGDGSYDGYGERRDNPPDIPVAGMARSRMFRCVATRLQRSRAPTEMRQELLYCGKAMNILPAIMVGREFVT